MSITLNYNGVNLLSNTTVWCVYIIYYIGNNYMFRRLIFRLYMNHLVSSYTIIYMGYLYGEGGVNGGTRSRICQNDWDVWDAWRIHAVTKLCLSLIIDKSMVGIILCLIVLRNYTEV